MASFLQKDILGSPYLIDLSTVSMEDMVKNFIENDWDFIDSTTEKLTISNIIMSYLTHVEIPY